VNVLATLFLSFRLLIICADRQAESARTIKILDSKNSVQATLSAGQKGLVAKVKESDVGSTSTAELRPRQATALESIGRGCALF
jgi:hypothetical protein